MVSHGAERVRAMIRRALQPPTMLAGHRVAIEIEFGRNGNALLKLAVVRRGWIKAGSCRCLDDAVSFGGQKGVEAAQKEPEGRAECRLSPGDLR